MADTLHSDAEALLQLLDEHHGFWLVPSSLQPGLMTRVRFAGNLLEEQGKAWWFNTSLLEQLRGHEPYALGWPIPRRSARFHVSVPDGQPKEPLYPPRQS